VTHAVSWIPREIASALFGSYANRLAKERRSRVPNRNDVAQSHLRAVEKASRERAQAHEALRRAIVLAHDSGETFVDISRFAGLSAERVRQIATEAKEG
jgi:hypothetical protein